MTDPIENAIAAEHSRQELALIEARKMRLVILESPFGANPDMFIPYARRAISDALERGEAPLASHLLYTQPGILDDTIADQRALGIEAGLSWYRVAEAAVIYCDHGISQGMIQGMNRAWEHGLPTEERYIGV